METKAFTPFFLVSFLDEIYGGEFARGSYIRKKGIATGVSISCENTPRSLHPSTDGSFL
jgi:hypothetical protein